MSRYKKNALALFISSMLIIVYIFPFKVNQNQNKKGAFLLKTLLFLYRINCLITIYVLLQLVRMLLRYHPLEYHYILGYSNHTHNQMKLLSHRL